MSDKEEIKWSLVEVDAKDVKVNPDNPKERNENGMNRLKKSLSKFGIVYDGICNKDLTFIDGHSRFELNEKGTLRVFVPSRQLDEDEYKEMNAIFDSAKAGDLDIEFVKEMFTEEQFDYWDLDKDEEKNEVDYSEKNKEVDVDSFEDEMILKLKYPEDEYRAVKEALLKIAQTPEVAIWDLLIEKGFLNEFNEAA